MAPSFKKHLINMYRVVFPKKQEGVYDIDKDKYEIAGLARGLEPGQKRGFYLLEPPSDIALERLIMTISQY